jgi:hypothetical protein
MKLQFSLATLLVCTAIVAVACMICVNVAVHDVEITRRNIVLTMLDRAGTQIPYFIDDIIEFTRPPTTKELALRLAWVAPLSIAATLVALWAVRRRNSRRGNGPPGG